MGAVSATQLDQFLDRIFKAVGDKITDPVETLLQAADQALESNSLAEAFEAYSQILQIEPEHPQALAGLANCWLKEGDVHKAAALLDTLPEAIQDHASFNAVRAAVKIALSAVPSSEIAALEQRLQKTPNDPNIMFELAQAQAAGGDKQAATDILLEIIRKERDWNDGAAKALLLTIFEAWGDIDPRTAKARRQLAMLLF